MYIGNQLRLHPKSFHHRIRDGYGRYFDNDQFMAIDPFDRSKFHDIYEPPANLREAESNFTLELILPGFTKDEIDLEVEGNRLIITGEKTTDKESEGESYIRKEHDFTQFRREFLVDERMDLEHIDAKFENGVLNILLHKKEEHTDKKEIEVA